MKTHQACLQNIDSSARPSFREGSFVCDTEASVTSQCLKPGTFFYPHQGTNFGIDENYPLEILKIHPQLAYYYYVRLNNETYQYLILQK